MITIKHVSATNFMSIDNLDLDFEDKTMINISGDNGAGKSSLFYLLAFGLFGYRIGESYRDYVKTGTDTSHIEIEAILFDEPLHIEADIYGNSKESKNHTPVSRKTVYKETTYLNSDHSQFLKDYELEDLTDIMFLFSNGGKGIIEARPTERATILKKIFKFDFTDQVNLFKEKQEQNKTLVTETNTTINDLKSYNYETFPLMREALPSVISQWQDRIKEIDTNIIKLGDINESLFKEYENKIINIENQIRTTTEKIERDTKSILNLNENIKIHEDFLNKYDVDSIKKDIYDKESLLEEHNKERKEQSTLVNSLTKDLDIQNYSLKEINNQIKISETGVCHACGQPVGKEHVNELSEKKKEIENTITNIRNKLLEINFDTENTKGAKIQKEIDFNRDLLKKYELEIKNKQSDEDRLKEINSSINDKKEYLKSLEDSKERLLKDKNEADKLKPLLSQKENLLTEKEELLNRVDKAKSDSIKNQERRVSNEKILREKQERDDKLKTLMEKSNELALKTSDLKSCIDIFENTFPSYAILQATNLLESFINDIIKSVFPYCTVRLQSTGKGVAFYYSVNDGEDWISTSMCSKGQQQVLNLAYRISLAKLSGIQSLFLDEIDSALTTRNAEIIYKMVAKLDCFQQVVFITHRQEAIDVVKETNPNTILIKVEKGEYTYL